MVVWVIEDMYILEDLHSQVHTLWDTHQAEINVSKTTLFLVLLQHVYYLSSLPGSTPHEWTGWRNLCVSLEM